MPIPPLPISAFRTLSSRYQSSLLERPQLTIHLTPHF
jgi:hypothetical protein